LLAVSTSAFALPPGADPALRDGANHEVGDDSFVAVFGRLPTDADGENWSKKRKAIAANGDVSTMAATATRSISTTRR
jgi:hypothetical protein